MVSLGCAKNKVDSEMILGFCKKEGMEVTDKIEQADILMVNTCAFIESAREEAINTILELASFKDEAKKLIVCGCLSQRYRNELLASLPEVDRFISIDEYPNIASILTKELESNFHYQDSLSPLNRVYSTPNYMRYVKISEGCTNRCAFCAIPLIRGGLRSRTIEDIVQEVKMHALDGVKEINLISQDTTKYGFDIYHKLAIVDLLTELVKIEGDFKIRLLYLYPDIVTQELISFIAKNDKVLPYFDIPIQHSEDHILKYMYRRGNKEFLLRLFQDIRKEIPHAVIRTTLIVGFPYETEDDVHALNEFIKEVKFDRLGAFTYSIEEDTPATKYPQIISQEEKDKRYNLIMNTQAEISYQKNQKTIGETFNVLIEDYDDESFMYVGRSYAYAPDDIDGCIFVAAHQELALGQIIRVKILDADCYTLTGEQIDA